MTDKQEKAEEARAASAQAAAPQPAPGSKQLSRFKYVGNDNDRGVNEFKSRTYYDIQFPLGVEVEVPDALVHKLRLKDDLEEVGSNVPKSHAEKLREKQNHSKAKAEARTGEVKIDAEELRDLREKAAKHDAQIERVRADAKQGK